VKNLNTTIIKTKTTGNEKENGALQKYSTIIQTGKRQEERSSAYLKIQRKC